MLDQRNASIGGEWVGPCVSKTAHLRGDLHCLCFGSSFLVLKMQTPNLYHSHVHIRTRDSSKFYVELRITRKIYQASITVAFWRAGSRKPTRPYSRTFTWSCVFMGQDWPLVCFAASDCINLLRHLNSLSTNMHSFDVLTKRLVHIDCSVHVHSLAAP